jgi:hypothetical protein
MPDEKPRDWDKELAEVDRLLAKLPHADPTLGKGAKPAPGAPGAAPAPGAKGHTFVTHPPNTVVHGSATGVWIRVGLGVLFGLAMTQWPYSHVCGLKLMFYVLGVGTVLAAGVWGAISSWRRRMGLPHLLSLGLTIWGLVLAAGVILPRTGYAKNAATWFCPEP